MPENMHNTIVRNPHPLYLHKYQRITRYYSDESEFVTYLRSFSPDDTVKGTVTVIYIDGTSEEWAAGTWLGVWKARQAKHRFDVATRRASRLVRLYDTAEPGTEEESDWLELLSSAVIQLAAESDGEFTDAELTAAAWRAYREANAVMELCSAINSRLAEENPGHGGE